MAHTNTSVIGLQQQAIETGAYYWFRAEGPEEHLESVTRRMQYQTTMNALNGMGIEGPSAADMFQHAKDKWPDHKLHPFHNGAGHVAN